MADQNDITIWNNAAWAGVATITNADGTVRDLTGCTFKTDIKASAKDSDAVIATLSTSNGRHTLSGTPTDGKLYFHIPLSLSSTIPAGGYVFDTLLYPSGGGDPDLLTQGFFAVRDGVTTP